MVGPIVLLLPPLAAIAAIVLSRNRGLAKYAALAGCLASLALLPFIGPGSGSIFWFSTGGINFGITTVMGTLNLLLSAIALVISILAILYSFRFMSLPTKQLRFYTEMLALVASMLALAIAGNFILLLIGWEFLSLTGYLLVGFYGRPRSNSAARRFVTITLIGGIALLAYIESFGYASTYAYAAIGMMAIALGALLSYLVYGRKKGRPARGASAFSPSGALNAAYTYSSVFIGIISDGIAHFDASLDGAFELVGHGLSRLSKAPGRFAVGELNFYVIVFAASLLLLLAVLAII